MHRLTGALQANGVTGDQGLELLETRDSSTGAQHWRPALESDRGLLEPSHWTAIARSLSRCRDRPIDYTGRKQRVKTWRGAGVIKRPLNPTSRRPLSHATPHPATPFHTSLAQPLVNEQTTPGSQPVLTIRLAHAYRTVSVRPQGDRTEAMSRFWPTYRQEM